MAIGKILEVSASSKTGFEDAVRQGIEKVSETVKNIQGAWVKEQKVEVENGKVVEYRVILSITFLVE